MRKKEQTNGLQKKWANIKTSHVHWMSELLLTFTRQKGKMQIVNKSLETSGSQEYYCKFTDSAGNTTRVDFNSQTGSLSAKDISEKKYQLCVNQLENGNY